MEVRFLHVIKNTILSHNSDFIKGNCKFISLSSECEKKVKIVRYKVTIIFFISYSVAEMVSKHFVDALRKIHFLKKVEVVNAKLIEMCCCAVAKCF